MKKIFHLLYTRRCPQPITSELQQSILESARRHNTSDQITGFLVSRDGYFMQLLEGNEVKVRDCFRRIELDPRHEDLVVLAMVDSTERLMPFWSMAQVEWRDDMASSTDLIQLFDLGRQEKVYDRMDRLLTILKKFSRQATEVAESLHRPRG